MGNVKSKQFLTKSILLFFWLLKNEYILTNLYFSPNIYFSISLTFIAFLEVFEVLVHTFLGQNIFFLLGYYNSKRSDAYIDFQQYVCFESVCIHDK